MTTLANAGRNTAQCQLGRPKPKIHDFNAIPSLLPTLQPSDVRQSAERRLERKIDARFRESVDLFQNQSAGGDCGELGLKRGQADGDQVRINEVNYSRILGEILAGKSRLAGAVAGSAIAVKPPINAIQRRRPSSQSDTSVRRIRRSYAACIF